MDILIFLLAPLAASLILAGIHTYLGVHVVERGVIFVDLALAQIAALGAIVALIVGLDPHGVGAYWISLGFTFFGAFLFSVLRSRRAHIPQEAFIGICYAVASAAAILAMSKATGETEHLKDMLVGNILAVSWHEVARTAVLYAGIGAFHYIFRKRFLLISMDPKAAEAQGISVRFWDFLFYASFGLVVTSSVAIAGVLLVSGLGVWCSVKMDTPTGATIVCTFGAVLALMYLIHLFVFHGHRGAAHQLKGAGDEAWDGHERS
jgi:zinc/manganese transport system permease protein